VDGPKQAYWSKGTRIEIVVLNLCLIVRTELIDADSDERECALMYAAVRAAETPCMNPISEFMGGSGSVSPVWVLVCVTIPLMYARRQSR
jgi:hypothetical protein